MDALDVLKQGGQVATKAEKAAAVLGIALFVLVTYSTMLSIHTNKVFLKKLKDEGYQ